MEQSLKFRTLLFNDRCYICNYFRTFTDVPNIPDAVNGTQDPVRVSLGLPDNQTIVSNDRLTYFRQFINETRQVSESTGGRVSFFSGGASLNLIASEAIKILRSKISKAKPGERHITNKFVDTTGLRRTARYYKQHYIGDLGNSNPFKPNGFGVTLFNRLQDLNLRTNTEKLISAILVVTSTNGMNIAGGGCIIVSRYAANDPINIPPHQEFTLLSNNVRIDVTFIENANFYIQLPADGGGVNPQAVNLSGADLNNLRYIDINPGLDIIPAIANDAAFGTNLNQKKFYVHVADAVGLQLPINTKIYNGTDQPQTISPVVAIDGTMG